MFYTTKNRVFLCVFYGLTTQEKREPPPPGGGRLELRIAYPGWFVKGKRKTLKHFCFKVFWQREKDSNPHKQSQSLSCYPYTIPLNFVFCDPQLTSAGLIIAKKWKLSRGFLKFFEKIFQVAVSLDSGVWAGLA